MNRISHQPVFIPSLLLTLAFLLSGSIFAAEEDTRPKISVSGSAEIQVKPDEAVFTFSIESREEKLDEAMKDNDEKIKAVVEFLGASDVEAKNIRTQVISIQPIFERNAPNRKGQSYSPLQTNSQNNAAPRLNLPVVPKKKTEIKPIGYTARRQLSITITKLETFETVYRGLIKRGVNNVGGISFQSTELRKHRDAARLKAVQAAREKAEAMSGELGAKLASVHSINEGGDSGWRSSSMQNSLSSIGPFDSTPTTVAAGMIKITASVNVVFILGETELKTATEQN